MKRIITILICALSVMIGHIQAQEIELTKEEKKEIQERIDSLQYIEAKKAIESRDFTLEADQVIFKHGENAYVNSNTNFVSVTGDEAVVQVAFNIPAAGPNGLGGITVEGTISNYEIKTDKRGYMYLSMNVMGTGISAQINISLPKGSSNATVDITPNFNSNRLTLKGIVLPSEKSSVFKGRSL